MFNGYFRFIRRNLVLVAWILKCSFSWCEFFVFEFVKIGRFGDCFRHRIAANMKKVLFITTDRFLVKSTWIVLFVSCVLFVIRNIKIGFAEFVRFGVAVGEDWAIFGGFRKKRRLFVWEDFVYFFFFFFFYFKIIQIF